MIFRDPQKKGMFRRAFLQALLEVHQQAAGFDPAVHELHLKWKTMVVEGKKTEAQESGFGCFSIF